MGLSFFLQFYVAYLQGSSHGPQEHDLNGERKDALVTSMPEHAHLCSVIKVP